MWKTRHKYDPHSGIGQKMWRCRGLCTEAPFREVPVRLSMLRTPKSACGLQMSSVKSRQKSMNFNSGRSVVSTAANASAKLGLQDNSWLAQCYIYCIGPTAQCYSKSGGLCN